MIIKANGQYLDFNGRIEIEKKIKLFEDIETTDGDFSFAFEVDINSHNLEVLGAISPDSISKIVYTAIPCELQNSDGLLINSGSLRIERVSNGKLICSFFGGNSNWFAMLTGNMTELRLDQYDVEQTQSNITASWNDTEGLIYPFLDLGALITRGYANAKTEDFVGSFYVHTLMKEVFQQAGLKIAGELLNDPLYKILVCVCNTRNKSAIDDRAAYVGAGAQSLTGTASKIDFNDSSDPYSIGSNDNFSLVDDRFTADVRMIVKVDLVVNVTGSGVTSVYLYKNGVQDEVKSTTDNNITITKRYDLAAGDYIEGYAREALGGVDIETASINIKPLFLYQTFGNAAVPLWTKQEFVSNIFRIFNVIPSYNPFTKTVTLNIFNNIKSKPAKDISDYIEVVEEDYTEFISEYGKVNNFTYQEGSDENLKDYNISSFVKYGAGTIEIDNEFVEPSADVVESDFSSPIGYVNPAFNCSMERINFVEIEEDEVADITSVTDSSGTPRFNITDADTIFAENDLVRFDTTVPEYNGDFVVTTVTSTYIVVQGLAYSSSATGTATKMIHSVTSDDNVYLLVNIVQTTSVSIMNKTGLYINQSARSTWTLAYFNLLRLGHEIEDYYKQSLSFGNVTDPLSFQRTLIDKYWGLFARMLSDPVKLKVNANLPWKVYNDLDFLGPVSIKTKESSNLYYVNKITGYEDSSIPCRAELIKLP